MAPTTLTLRRQRTRSSAPASSVPIPRANPDHARRRPALRRAPNPAPTANGQTARQQRQLFNDRRFELRLRPARRAFLGAGRCIQKRLQPMRFISARPNIIPPGPGHTRHPVKRAANPSPAPGGHRSATPSKPRQPTLTHIGKSPPTERKQRPVFAVAQPAGASAGVLPRRLPKLQRNKPGTRARGQGAGKKCSRLAAAQRHTTGSSNAACHASNTSCTTRRRRPVPLKRTFIAGVSCSPENLLTVGQLARTAAPKPANPLAPR
jgi:hypothetical protein